MSEQLNYYGAYLMLSRLYNDITYGPYSSDNVVAKHWIGRIMDKLCYFMGVWIDYDKIFPTSEE